jgi:hypothetical protein
VSGREYSDSMISASGKNFKEFEKVTLKYFRNNKKINSAADFGGKPVTS